MNLLAVKGVTRQFGDLVAVDQVTMSVHSGEVVGLVGANGAGKTTLIRMILGLLGLTSGSIRVLGEEPGKSDPSNVGYVPQGLGLYTDLTVVENLEFVAGAFSVPPTDLDIDLNAVADQQVGTISLGLQRRLAFAAVLTHDPKLLILDEPTSGVGPVGRVGLWERIRSEAETGAGVLVSTHYMEEAEQCDRILMMANGRIVASGTIDEITGGRFTPYVTGVTPDAIAGSHLLAIPDGVGWRIPGATAEDIGKRFPGATIESRPMDFEEAFIGFSE